MFPEVGLFLAYCLLVVVILAIYVAFRGVFWVQPYREGLIFANYEKYRKLPSQEKMWFMFWRKIDSDKWVKG